MPAVPATPACPPHATRPPRATPRPPAAGRYRAGARLGWLGLLVGLAAAAVAVPVTVETADTVLTLDSDAGYAVTQLTDRATGHEFLAPPAEGQDRSLWHLSLRDGAGVLYPVRPADAERVTATPAEGGLTLVWEGLRVAACEAELRVTVTIRPRPDGALGWRLALAGQAAAQPWFIDFPRVMAVQRIGDDQLALPIYLGRMMTDPARRPGKYVIEAPQPAAMQWFAFYGTPEAREPAREPVEGALNETGWVPDRSDAACLYWGTADGLGQYKRYGLDGDVSPDGFGWWVGHAPALTTWPIAPGRQAIAYEQPYDVVTTTFRGDWLTAARRYEQWAREQVWTGRGTMDTWPDQPPATPDGAVRWTPPWFREVGFWAKFYQEPAKVVPEWAAYAKWLGVPMASHYYRHPISRFDDNYPEHLPADPWFLQGMRAARQMGVAPLPYVQGSIWDMDTQSWYREEAVRAAVKDEAGKLYEWNIANELFAYLNPSSQLWQDKMVEVGEKMIGEHGCAGIYLDVLDATRPKLNYDASQGTGVHGGNYWAAGNRKLLYELRRATRQVEPGASFFSEAIGETYLDLLDGHLSLDQLRFHSGKPGEQIWPLFPAVYHPYTINFGNDANLSQDPDFFAWEMGQMLVWGSIPLNSMPGGTLPQPGDPASEILREVVQAYWQAGRPFLCGGQMERLAIVPADTPAAATGSTLAAAPYALPYKSLNKPRAWHGPAVMGAAWSRQGRTAYVLVNITDRDQPITLTLPADAGPLAQLWPAPEALGAGAGAHPLTVPARRVLILQIGDEPPAPLEALRAQPWELQTVEDGPFPPWSGPAGTLWASDDAPVDCTLTAGGTAAQAQQFGADGTLTPRRGVHPPGGAAREGHGLPRAADTQPFLLLRQLPQTVTGAGSALVWSADATHLVGAFDGGLTVHFPVPGLAIVRNLADGSLTRLLADGPAESLTLPAAGRYLVGWADPLALRPQLTLPGEVLKLAPLVGNLREMLAASPSQQELFLAEASQALFDLEAGLTDALGELLAGRPLRILHDAIQALVVARVGWAPVARAADDWLAPQLAKAVQYAAWVPGPAEDPYGVELRLPGGWPVTGVTVPRAAGDRVRLRSLPLTFAFQVGEVVERLAPVIAAADVPAGSRRFRLASLMFLEANRPFELRVQKLPLAAVGGREAQAQVTFRNWSPLPLTLQVGATGPDGWTVNGPPTVEVPALSDRTVAVAVTPALASPRGGYQLGITANHSAAAESAQVGQIEVALRKNLVPLNTTGDWAPPAPDNITVHRRSGTLVVIPEGDRIRGTIENRRVTIYNDTATWRLLDPDLVEVAKGDIKVDETYTLDEPAATPGCYTLEVVPKAGSCIVTLDHRHVAEVAMPETRLLLFGSRITRYFRVPEGARQFGLGWLDGGPDETCRFRLTSPTGRVALDFEEKSTGTPKEVTVGPDESGLWELRMEPRQDIDIWLTGDAEPFLSSSPARMVQEAR